MLDPKTHAQDLLTQHPMLGQKIAKATSPYATDSEKGLEETIKFLILANESQAMACTPSKRIDMVWHELILFTRLYSDFCQKQFGKFIHHEPATSGKSCSIQYEVTLKRYAQRFGPPDVFWWEVSANGRTGCSMCDTFHSKQGQGS